MLCYTSWTALLEAGYYGHEAVVQARLAIVANVDHAGVADETSLSLSLSLCPCLTLSLCLSVCHSPRQ